MELRKDRGCSSTKKIKRQWAVFKTLHRKLNIEQYKPIFDCAIIHSRIYTNINKNIFEDTNEVIRIRKSKKNRQYNGQKKRDKKTNNDLQNTTQKTKDRATQTPSKAIDWRRKYNTMVKRKGQIDKQRSTKHYTEN
jgi:hypothetical protein